MKNRRRTATLLLLTILASFAANAETAKQKAEEKLKASFSNLNVTGFDKAPIPGLYEVNIGSGIIYFNPEKELLFFGEIYNKDGESLTAASLTNASNKQIKKLPMESGLVIGDAHGVEIIEFTDPDCPFCRKYEQFMLPIMKTRKIKRTVYFDTRIHPDSAKKVEHIICSKNQEKAFHDTYAGKVREFKTCKKADSIIKKHREIAEKLGVSGTPSFLMNGKITIGYKPGLIIEYLNKQEANSEG